MLWAQVSWLLPPLGTLLPAPLLQCSRLQQQRRAGRAQFASRTCFRGRAAQPGFLQPNDPLACEEHGPTAACPPHPTHARSEEHAGHHDRVGRLGGHLQRKGVRLQVRRCCIELLRLRRQACWQLRAAAVFAALHAVIWAGREARPVGRH